jgi:hypothetical protein
MIYRFRLTALLLVLKCLMVPAIGGLLAYSMIRSNHQLTIIAMGIGLATLLLAIVQWMLATRTRCPLCMTPVLATKSCSKHRHARRFLGSYRLRVALAVLFRNSFHCPYCHEKSAMEVRTRHH